MFLLMWLSYEKIIYPKSVMVHAQNVKNNVTEARVSVVQWDEANLGYWEAV